MKTLRVIRAERLLSTRRLASLSGVSNKTIVQIENGRQTPAFVTIEKLCRVLEVEPRDIVEFARAIDQRAGLAVAVDTFTTDRRPLHVFCISLGATQVFHSLTRRLLETDRFGVTAATSVALRPQQIACCSPDLVVVDVDVQPARIRDLLTGLRSDTATMQIPIVLTGRTQQPLDAMTAALGESDQPAIITVPLTHDLSALMAAIETLAVEPPVTHPAGNAPS